ncbi:MAG: SDR family NAD(P)-dependent oxidoreductase [Waltera sp.]
MNIVIIGGSRGIGKAAARELLQDGNNVLIVGRNPKTLEETGKELAGAATYSCDAGKAEETTGLVDAVKKRQYSGISADKVDGLILCAATFPNPSTQDIRSTAGAGGTAGNA